MHKEVQEYNKFGLDDPSLKTKAMLQGIELCNTHENVEIVW